MAAKESPIKKDITRRSWIVYWLFVLFGLVILGRIVYIQYGPESSELKARAVDSKTFRMETIEAQRGDIYSYDGKLLATSVPVYDLRMDFKATGLTDSIFRKNVDSLAHCLSVFFKDKSKAQYKTMLEGYRKKANQKNGQRVYRIAPRRVSYLELLEIKKFPILRHPNRNVSGFLYEKINNRSLPYGEIAQRTIGVRVNDSLKWGVEGAFDDYLKGTDGQTKTQRISGTFWMPVADEMNVEPENGYDVVTTLDIDLQDVAERALRAQLQSEGADWGTAILMEVETGEIRAMANLTRRRDGTCVDDLNHAINQRINPGSTFKLAVLMVLLEDAGMSLDDLVQTSGGHANIRGKIVRDSHSVPQEMTLRKIFEESSNVGFARAVDTHYWENKQKFVDALVRTGVNDTLPIQLEGYRGPLIHTDPKRWSNLTLASMSYGYELEMTPIQTLTLYNAVANNGKMVSPVIVRELQQYGETVKTFKTEVVREKIASPKTIKLVQEALLGVASDGTARRLRIDDLEIAVKTGTAQIPNRNQGYGAPGAMNYLATIVGYFPAENPKYTCIVAMKTYTGSGRGANYYGGSLAGPVFKAIAERVYGMSTEWNPPVSHRSPLSAEYPRVKGGDARNLTRALDRLAVPYRTEPRISGWITPEYDSTGLHLVKNNISEENTMPDVTGMGLSDAVEALEKAGLVVEFTGKGQVIRQSVSPGASVRNGQKVTLTLAVKK